MNPTPIPTPTDCTGIDNLTIVDDYLTPLQEAVDSIESGQTCIYANNDSKPGVSPKQTIYSLLQNVSATLHALLCLIGDETLTTITDNGDGTFTYVDEVGADTTISVCSLISGLTMGVSAPGDKMVITDGVGNCKLLDYVPAVDTNAFHLDETGSDFPPGNTAPANPPANLDPGDTVIEHWDDTQVYWTWDGTNWVKNWVLSESPDILTSITDNGDGTFTYLDENADPTVISVCTLMGYCTLNAIGDVNAPSPTSGQVLTWNGTSWVATTPASFSETVTTLVNNNNGSFTYTNELGSTTNISVCSLISYCSLDAIGDVNAPSPTSGQVLTWNGTSWVATTPAVGFAGFSINDTNAGTPIQPIASGDTITFIGNNLITSTVTATDTVTHGINTSGATAGQVITFNGTNVVWGTAPASGSTNTMARLDNCKVRFSDSITGTFDFWSPAPWTAQLLLPFTTRAPLVSTPYPTDVEIYSDWGLDYTYTNTSCAKELVHLLAYPETRVLKSAIGAHQAEYYVESQYWRDGVQIRDFVREGNEQSTVNSHAYRASGEISDIVELAPGASVQFRTRGRWRFATVLGLGGFANTLASGEHKPRYNQLPKLTIWRLPT